MPSFQKSFSAKVLRVNKCRVIRLFWLFYWFVGILSWQVQAQPQKDWAHQMAKFVGSHRTDGALWGIEIANLNSGQLLFATNEHVLLKIASNQKLFSAAWALAELGPKTLLPTSVHIHGQIDSQGVLQGDLVISGVGDPTWGSDRVFASVAHQWESLLALIKSARIQKIDGRLVADVSRITGSRWGTNRLASDLIHPFAAEVSALNDHENYTVGRIQPSSLGLKADLSFVPSIDPHRFNNKVITVNGSQPLKPIYFWKTPSNDTIQLAGDIRTNGVPQRFELAVSDPPRWFLERFRKKLNESGVEVTGTNLVRETMERLPKANPLGVITSPPLHEIVSVMVKDSQNLYAETLFRLTGEKMRNRLPITFTSEQSAVLRMTDWLVARGIPRDELQVQDGSGLSTGSLSTAHGLVTLLRWSREWEHYEVFRSSLPVAGIDGTLKKRFIGSRSKGKLWAKTGTLTGVAALSGFMESESGELLVFSILLNNYKPAQGKNAREVLDDLIELMAEWQPSK